MTRRDDVRLAKCPVPERHTFDTEYTMKMTSACLDSDSLPKVIYCNQ